MKYLLLCALLPLLCRAEESFAAKGFNHYYNLEYDQAISDFERAAAADPAAPDPHNHIAQAILYREMFRNGALESELVSGNNSFLRRPKLNTNAETQNKFDSEVQRAMELSQKRIDANPRDSSALYSSGVAYGLRSNYNFLVRKAWKDALRDATTARKLHNRVTEIDPGNYDARLVQGVHDYVVGSLPWTYKSLGFLFGFRGDKEQGLKTLEEVARKGKYNRVDAEILLCALYRREGRAKRALPLLEDVLKRYPRDYLLRFEQAQMYSSIGDKRNALEAMSKVAELKRAGAAGYANIPWEKIYYETGNISFWYKDYDRALRDLQMVTASPKELDLNTGVLAFMRQGQVYDLTNRHQLAVEAYKKAIAFAPEAEAAKESRRYISSPYRGEKGNS